MNTFSHKDLKASVGGMRTQVGFTVMELMIVLAIVGILLASIGPSFNNLLDRNTVQKASSDLTMSILLARAEAVKRNQSVVVAFNGSSWNDGWSVTSGGGVEVISNFDATEGITITGPDSLTFLGNGRAQNLTNNRFTLTSAGGNIAQRCLYLSTSGKTKVLVDADADGVCANG